MKVVAFFVVNKSQCVFFLSSLKCVDKYLHVCRMCVKIQGVIFKVARIFRVFFFFPHLIGRIAAQFLIRMCDVPNGKALKESTN